MMNKSVVCAALAVAALGACGAASAQQSQGMYVGGVLSRVDYKEDGIPTYKPTAAAIVLGKEITPNFAAEVRLGTGLSSDTQFVTIPGVGSGNIKLEVEHYLGVYGKGILPLSPVASVYGLLGYTSGKLKISGAGGSATTTDGSLSFGFGADFAVAKTTSIGIEWARLVHGDGYDLNALSLIAKVRF